MTGFLVAGALAGLVSVGWPVYLHLRRRQRAVVQVIPSLRLFDTARKLVRFPLLERVLLLAARVLFLGALFVMLAQPFVETKSELSLPRIDERRADCRVGLLLDDSLTSLHGPGGRTRLDASVEWLMRQVKALPKRSRVTIVLTSFPHPTRPMSTELALEFLGRVKPIPRAGKAVKALAALHDALRGRIGAIIVAAPRDGALWEDLSEGTDLERAAGVHFLDMTPRRLPWFIQSVEPATASGENGWVLDLAGDPREMEGGELAAEGSDGRQWRYRITQSDARRGRANLLLPAGVPPYWYVVRGRPRPWPVGSDAAGSPGGAAPPDARADEGGTHPWLSWYLRAESLPQRERLERAAVLRPRTREGALADRIVASAIQSVYPETAILHVDPRDPPAELPPAGAVVCIGALPPDARLSEWLRSCLDRGARVLCLQTEGPAGEAGVLEEGGALPAWGRPMPVTPEKILPLRNVARPSDPGYGIDEFLVKGLSQVRYARLREPRFGDRGRALITTDDESPFLVARRYGESGRVFALAAPVSLASGSVAYHPSFPLLVRRLLFERSEVAQTALGDVEVGGTVDILRWFGVREILGTVVLPGGATWDVRSPTGLPVRTVVSLAGPHLLRTEDATRVRVANYPRLKRDATFTSEDWVSRRPNTPAVWLSESAPVVEDFGFIGEDPDREKPGRYDLSPLAVPLVAAFLALELASLLWYWRRGRAPDGSPALPPGSGPAGLREPQDA